MHCSSPSGQPNVPSRPTGAITLAGRPYPAKLSGPNTILPRDNRRDPLLPLPVITSKELDKGILSCIDRGLIPAVTDVGSALTDGINGLPPLSTEGAATLLPAVVGSPPGCTPSVAPEPEVLSTGSFWPKGHPLSDQYTESPRAQARPWAPAPRPKKAPAKKEPIEFVADADDEFDQVVVGAVHCE